MENLLGVLKIEEASLLREVESERLALLDEDQILALHKRVRRARNKYTTNYRRKAAERVADEGVRSTPRPLNAKAAQRAEAFETALSLVSAQLADAAAQSAQAIKAAQLC